MKLLTDEDKLKIIKLAEQGKSITMDRIIDKWIEDNKVRGGVCSYEYSNNKPRQIIWFKGYYYQCLEWIKQADNFYNVVREKIIKEKLNKYE